MASKQISVFIENRKGRLGEVLDVLKEQPLGKGTLAFGEVLVTWLVTMFKKFKLDTQETLGFGPVDLPELEMPTNACWWALDETLTATAVVITASVRVARLEYRVVECTDLIVGVVLDVLNTLNDAT